MFLIVWVLLQVQLWERSQQSRIWELAWGLGPVVMGIIIHTASYPIMFLCLALTGVINLNYFYFFVRKKGAIL